MGKRIGVFIGGMAAGLLFFVGASTSLAGGSFFIDDVTSFVGIGNTTPASRLDVSGAMYSRLVTASSSAIDWNQGNVQMTTLSSSPTLTFSNGQAGGEYTLILNQDSTGSRAVTWPASVKWENGLTPVLSTEANATDKASFVFDGSRYLGSLAKSFGQAKVLVKAWGAGGGSNGAGASGDGGSAGSGGAYSQSYIAVISGTGYTVTVGSGGGAGISGIVGGGNGGDSWFDSSVTLLAKGGGGGGGTGGFAAAGVGQVKTSGGTGGVGTGVSGDEGGGGGGSGGDTTNGGNGSQASSGVGGTGGTAGSVNGVAGSAGATGSSNGNNGIQPGGGAGGAGLSGSNGGVGGDGEVIVVAPLGAISATGGTHTTSGGNDIWTFTSGGTWTPTF